MNIAGKTPEVFFNLRVSVCKNAPGLGQNPGGFPPPSGPQTNGDAFFVASDPAEQKTDPATSIFASTIKEADGGLIKRRYVD